MIAPRDRFPPSALLPVLVGAAVASQVPGLPTWTLLSLLGTVLLRRVLLRRTREWTGGQGWLAVWILTPVALAAVIPATMGEGRSTAGAVLGALTLLTAVSVCAPPTGVGLLRLVGLSAGGVALAAAVAPTGLVFGGVTAWVAALAFALLDLERRRASPFTSGSQASLRHVRARAADGALPPRVARQALRLAAVALPLALWLFVTLPTKPQLAVDPRTSPAGGPATGGASGEDAEGRDGGGAIRALDAFVSGARTKMRLDFVRRVQGDQRPVLLVRVGEGEDPGTSLLLRGLTYDRLAEDERGVASWTRSSALTQDDRVAVPDAAESEWIWLGLDPAGRPPVRHVIRDLQGHAGGQLFLPPGPRRLRFDAELDDPRVRVSKDGVVLGLGRLRAGGGYEVDAPGPGQARRPTPAARSDAAVAPLATYVASPPDVVRLRAIAKEIVGEATAPSDRADRIEAWLRGLAYSKEMPQVDPRHPLVDFLTRVRAGHCEWFASSMAALLRSLGHPTRLVVGFRGGDFLASIGWVSFRGSHAHAWCETWFEGFGWVPYDPTPADAREGRTGLRGPGGEDRAGDDAEAEGAAEADGTQFLTRLLRFSRADRRRLADDAARILARTRSGLERAVERIVPGAGAFAWPALGAAALALGFGVRALRRRRAAAGGRAADPGSKRREGPYARALTALAGAGLRRKGAHTPGEHRRRVVSVLPVAAPAFGALTDLHVRARYGERPWTAEEQAAAETAAGEVERTVGEVRRGGRSPSGAPPLPGGTGPG